MKKTNLTVALVSPGNSGGGAVHDYLMSRSDFASPFQGEEFRLISDPYGIENMYNCFYNNFSINNSSEAFEQFKSYCFYLNKLRSSKNKKLIYGKNFYKISLEYLKNIEKISYRGIPQFKSISLSFKNKNLFKIKKKFLGFKNHEHSFYRMRIPKDKKTFIFETKKYLEKIFKHNLGNFNKKNIVLDQATNFWKPEIIFKYFNKNKIILVTRDPRSIFYSMKFRGSYAYPGYDVNKFVEWYRQIMNKKIFIKKENKNKILEIKFEKFINDFSNEKKRINKFLNISAKYSDFIYKKGSSFDHKVSKKNVYKARDKLSKNELVFIEKKLQDYLQW